MTEKVRVLYVDDESALLDIGKLYLERSGEFTVTTATSAPEAIRILGQETFDTIVSDYQMPEMDGIEFLKHLKADDNTTPFIIFTGKGREEVVIEALNAGADFYLQKGGESKSQFAELSHKIKKAVEGRQAEEAFKDSEERFRSLFDSALDMIQIIRPDGSFLHVNPAWKKTLGYSDDDVRTLSVFDIFHPDSLAHCSIKFHELFSGAKALNIEAQFLTKDKKTISVEGNCNPEIKDGTVVSIRGIFHDVTERKLAEEALRESETRYRSVVEDQTEFICRFTPNGKLTFVNDAYCRYFSLNKDRCLARPHSVVLPPEDVRQMKQHFASLTRENPVATIEHRIIMPSGEVRWQRWNDRAIVDQNGNVVEYQSVGRDITEIKNAEKSLLEREAYYRTLFENTGTASVIVEEDTTISLANAEFAVISGYPRQEIEGKRRWTEFVVKEDLERMLAQHHLRRKDGKPAERNYEFGFVRKSGEIRNIFLSIDVISGTKKSIASLLDITEYKKAVQALRESEERFRNIFVYATEGILIADISTQKFLHANSAICSMLGYSAEELVSMEVKDLHPEKDLARVEEEFKAQACGEKNLAENIPVLRKDGAILYMDIRTTPLMIDGHLCNLGMFTDITDRKKAEEALRESERRYRSLAEASIDMIYIIDRNDTVQYINTYAAQLLHSSVEQIIGKSRKELFPPQIADEQTQYLQKIFKTGIPLRSESKIQFGDHELWIDNNLVPLKDEKGNVLSVLGISRDITERKKAEQSLQDAALRWQSTFDSTQDAICILDADQRIVTCNRMMQEILGVKNADDLVARHCWEVVHKTTEPIPGCPFVRMRHSLTREQMELKIGERWAVVTADPILDETGTLIGAVHNIRDITDRKRVAESLRETEERYRTLVASVTEVIILQENTGEILTWNRAAERLFGVTSREVLGHTATSWKWKTIREDGTEFPDSEHPSMHTIATGEACKNVVMGIMSNEGKFSWVNINTSPLFKQGDAKPYAVVISLLDITERKQAEEALLDSEAKSRSLLEGVPELILVHRNGIILYTNPASVKSLGYQPHEALNRQVTDFIAPEFHERVAAAVRQRMNGKPVEPYEIDVMSRDGIRRTMVVNGSTIEFDGAPASLIILIDITERKKVEEALQESEERYSSLFDNNYSVSLLIDPETGRIVDANAAAVQYYGYTHDILSSMGIYDLNRLPKEKVVTNLQRAKNEKAKHFFSTHYLATGEKRNVEIYSGPITLQKKPLFYSIIHDITDRKRAEEALRESETRYREFFTISRDSIFITSPEGRWIDFNDALVEMFGYESRKEMFEVPVQSIYADSEERIAFTQRIKREGFVKEYPVLGKKKDGTVIDTIITTVPVRNPDGSTKAFIGTLRDVTKQKRAEQEIRTLQQFQQSIIDNANVWFSVLDPKGTILVWNITAEQISEYPAKDVIGKNTIWKQLYPDPVYRKQVAENILDIIKKNTYVENFETRIRTKSGDEKIIWWNTQPQRDTSGKPVQFITIGRDNTERKHSEENLRALRQFEESVIKNANIWISVLDGKGNVSVWNRAAEEISGYPADEVIGKNTIWSRMYPDKDYRRTVTAKIKEILGANKYLENFETRIRTKDGQERIIWWNTRALQDVPGIDETFIAIGKDVTEQKTLQDAVQLANKKLNLLSSITRHDILNQLMALKGYLELSHEIINDPTTLTEYIKKEETAAKTIEEQITFTGDYQELGVAAPVWQNVNASIEKALTGLPMRDVRAEVDRSDLEIFADPLFEKVFYNLIDNALHYGGVEMNTIRVSSQESDRGLTIVCEDDGIGISEENKKRLFTRGFGHHTGLGLFLSREILSITGITIAENGTPGKGARFEITVPKGMWRMKGASE